MNANEERDFIIAAVTNAKVPTVHPDAANTIDIGRAVLAAYRTLAAPTAQEVTQQAAREMAIAQAVRRACVESYSPDDLAGDWSEKMGDLNLSSIIKSIAPATQQAAKAETAEQAEGEQANVLPPFAAPAGQHGAWIAAKDQLPEKYCLAVYETARGQQRIIRAMHVKQYEIEASGDECDSEINDADDIDYLREGWYELIDNWGDYSSVKVNEGVVTHWMPLPSTPDQMSTAGAAKGGEDKPNSSDLAPTTSTVSAPEEVRNQALEEAAQIADAEYAEFLPKAGDNNGRESDFAFGSVNSAERIAGAIRALRTTSGKGEAA